MPRLVHRGGLGAPACPAECAARAVLENSPPGAGNQEAGAAEAGLREAGAGRADIHAVIVEDSPLKSDARETVASDDDWRTPKASFAEGTPLKSVAEEAAAANEDGLVASSAPIAEFFFWHADELHLSLKDAKAKADLLARDELLWTTEDLYRLEDRDTFLKLPLPLHMRRWLFKERRRLLADPLRFQQRERLERVRTRKGQTLEFEDPGNELPCVEVTVQVNAVSRLYVKDLQFDADFTLMFDWVDVSVIGRTEEEVQLWELFNPEIVIENAIGDDQPLAGGTAIPRMKRVEDGRCVDGHMKKTCRYRITLMCSELDLRAFPFDTQTLPISLKARNPAQRLVGPEGASGVNVADGLRASGHSVTWRADHLSEWSFHSVMGVRQDPADRFYKLNMIVFRDPQHVMWTVCFPTMMILLFSFTAYAIPIAELNGRLEITSTCLLGMMAFQGTVKEMLPPLRYLTSMGMYVIVTFLVLIVHGVEHALAHIMTSDSSLPRDRSKPFDIFFGSVDFWDERSEEFVHREAIWVMIELAVLVLFHAIFFFRLLVKRRQSESERRREAQRPGVSLVLVSQSLACPGSSSHLLCPPPSRITEN